MNRATGRTVAAMLAVAAIGLVATGCAPKYEGDSTDCLVNDKQAISRDSATDYRIFSTCGVFGVQDDPFIGQWNSADTFTSIEVGKTYDFEAYGWRNGFFSTFPNIKSATEVSR
jgi:hypothetical protein